MAFSGDNLLGVVVKDGAGAMPKNCYQRGGVWWARARIQGHEYRESLERPVTRTPEHVAAKLAAEWLDRLRAELRGEIQFRTFDEIAEFFILERLPELKPRGAERYRLSLRNLLPYFEGRQIEEITAETLRAFEKGRRADPGRSGGGVSSGTIRRDLQCLSAAISFFADAHDLDLSNPVRRYLRRRARQGALMESPPRTRYLTHPEEDRLLASIRRRHEKDRRLRWLAEAVTFAIDTGLRLEEQFSMRWDDVDLARKRIRVRADVAKSGKERVVPLLERSAQILTQMPRRLREAGEPPWIWCRPDGDRYPHRDKAFGTAVTRAGLKDVTWHDLRRTCGCRRLQDMGWRKEQVQALLGHASITTTEQIYAFLTVDQLEEVGTESGTRRTDSEDQIG
ncbi:MAG: site-specific integrase [Pseudomonadota bacterium]